MLLRLLDEQKEETSLLGTGWDDEDLVRLLAKIDPEPPEGWATFDEDSLLTDHQCPKCGYEWS